MKSIIGPFIFGLIRNMIAKDPVQIQAGGYKA